MKDVVATVARNEVELCMDFVNKVIMNEFDRSIAPNDSSWRINATLYELKLHRKKSDYFHRDGEETRESTR